MNQYLHRLWMHNHIENYSHNFKTVICFQFNFIVSNEYIAIIAHQKEQYSRSELIFQRMIFLK